MRGGRIVCVALPFVLTVASIIFLLIAALAGITDKSLYMFRANVEKFAINPLDSRISDAISHLELKDILRTRDDSSNITASDLGLEKIYDVYLWGFCYTDQSNKHHCKKAEYNWAEKYLKTDYIDNFGSAAGKNIQLPKEITGALKAFKLVTKWTEVAYMFAFCFLAAELVIGFFTGCSRIMSCCTWVVGGFAMVFVGIAAGMSTFMAAVVVGAIDATAKVYGVKGNINSSFLGVVWMSFALALAAWIFWLATICCCKPESRSSRKNRHSDGEKLLPVRGAGGGYAPLGNDHEMTAGGGFYNHNQANTHYDHNQSHSQYDYNQSQSQYGLPRYPSDSPRTDLAYEPYSHRA